MRGNAQSTFIRHKIVTSIQHSAMTFLDIVAHTGLTKYEGWVLNLLLGINYQLTQFQDMTSLNMLNMKTSKDI